MRRDCGLGVIRLWCERGGRWDGQGCLAGGALRDPLVAFCRMQVSIQLQLLEGYEKRLGKALLQMLLMEPVVDSVSNAEKMLDCMGELQQDYLGE